MAGRHITFTKEIGQQVLAARKVGATLRECVKAAGVAWPTFCRWRRMRDDGKHDELAIFFVELDKAEVFKQAVAEGERKIPLLTGKTCVNLFFENSTRTRTSFELAGKRLFLESGFERTSMDAIAAAAGVSPRAAPVSGSTSAMAENSAATSARAGAVANSSGFSRTYCSPISWKPFTFA